MATQLSYAGWQSPKNVFGSGDAFTDSNFRVNGCIHRPKNVSRWMHPPTQKLELVNTSTDPKNELTDASPDSNFLVCACIYRPEKRGHHAYCPMTVHQTNISSHIYWGQVLIQGAPLTPCKLYSLVLFDQHQVAFGITWAHSPTLGQSCVTHRITSMCQNDQMHKSCQFRF